MLKITAVMSLVDTTSIKQKIFKDDLGLFLDDLNLRRVEIEFNELHFETLSFERGCK